MCVPFAYWQLGFPSMSEVEMQEVEAYGFRIVTIAEKRVQHTDPGFSL